MTPLWLLRHGPPLHPATLTGWRDDPPSPQAEAEWPLVRAALAALGAGRVLCSDLARARRFAADLGLPCTALPGLREQRFGAWEGRRWDELPEAEARALCADPLHRAPPGGEPFAACAARACAALAAHLDEATPTLVIAHAGSLRAILAAALGLPLARAPDLAWDPWGLTRLDRYRGLSAVLRWHNRRLAG